jgi:cytochrome c oxidase subunit 2
MAAGARAPRLGRPGPPRRDRRSRRLRPARPRRPGLAQGPGIKDSYLFVSIFTVAIFVLVELPGIANVPSAGAGNALEVKVTGRQFYWQYEYPKDVVAIDRMRAPEGVPVRLELTAPDDDVIHSWWIPALGGKLDAIPGRTNVTWFEATRTGTFGGQCAELCGIAHAKMLATVEVLPRGELEAWLERRRLEQSAVGSGWTDEQMRALTTYLQESPPGGS